MHAINSNQQVKTAPGHREIKPSNNRKYWIYLILIILLCTSIQTLWTAPNNISSADLSSSPLGYLPWLCILPIFGIILLNILFNRYKTNILQQAIFVTIFMIFYWLMVNYSEFTAREASWSTYTTTESWFATLMISILPISICGTIFLFSIYFLLKKYRNPNNLKPKWQ